MTEPLLPGPVGPDPTDHTRGCHDPGDCHRNDKRARSKIPSEDECLQAIGQLGGLIAMGLLKPAQANAIRASFRDILQHHQRSQSRHDHAGIGDADVLDLMRKDPTILNMLAPLLTDEQLAMIMQQDKGGDGGTT